MRYRGYYIWLTLALLLVVTVASAQQDTLMIQADSVLQNTPKRQREGRTSVLITDSIGAATPDTVWPRPNRAATLSLLLPGLGQAYNKQYWKIPLVYGAIGTTLGIALWNNRQYKYFDGVFKDLVRAQTDSVFALTYTPPSPNFNTSTARRARDGYRRQRDFSIFLTVVAYALNSVEAYVAAHLRHFDVSDDLSLEWRPYVSPLYTQQGGMQLQTGLSFTLQIK